MQPNNPLGALPGFALILAIGIAVAVCWPGDEPADEPLPVPAVSPYTPEPTPAPEPAKPKPRCPDCPREVEAENVERRPFKRPRVPRPRFDESASLLGRVPIFSDETLPSIRLTLSAVGSGAPEIYSTARIGTSYRVEGQTRTAKIAVGGPTCDGAEVAADLPVSQHLRNKGGSDGPSGPGSGSGLCVFTSCEHSGQWCSEPVLIGLRDWMTNHPGGGYPEKVSQMLTKRSRELRLPEPKYLQVTNGDIAVVEAALASRRMPAVTYDGRDGVYYTQSVAHMVNLCCFDRAHDRACILDNNYPGKYLWMSCSEFLERWKAKGGGWAVIPRRPAPPPVPTAAVASASGVSVRDQGPTRGELEWRRVIQANGIPAWRLYEGASLVGGLSTSGSGLYFPFVTSGNHWATAATLPPIPIPSEAWPAQPTTLVNYGVDLDRVRSAPAYLVGDTSSNQARVLSLMARADDNPKLPDDRHLLWVTVAGGDDAARARVVADIEQSPQFAGLRERVQVKEYAAGHWALDVGTPASGVPSITIQAPDSAGKAKVLQVLDRYDGPDALAVEVATAIRKADPSFDASRWIDREVSQAFQLGDWAALAVLLALIVGVIGLIGKLLTAPPATTPEN